MINGKKLVEDALVRYQQPDGHDSTAGFDILRYKQKGRLKPINKEVYMELRTALDDWYPKHEGHVWLRFAKAGKLDYNPTLKELEEMKKGVDC